jgi:hypothetical protein
MANIICNVPNWLEIRDYLNLPELRCQVRAETARCAKGRENFWLQAEPDYQTKKYRPAVMDDRLWSWIKDLVPAADLAQVIYGNRGIHWHRDATYAAPTAWLLSLGRSTFEIKNDEGETVSLDFCGGELIEFNCKKMHRAINVCPDRLAIGIWAAKIPIPEESLKGNNKTSLMASR